MASTDPPVEIEECRGVLRVYSDGSIVRSPNPSFPVPITDDGTVEWKDVEFDPKHGLSTRLYKPRDSQGSKLAIFFYFHGGGFCIGSRTWPNCHNYCLRQLQLNDRFWRLSVPIGASTDHLLVNPFGPHESSSVVDLESVEFDPILVVVGGCDLLRDRAVDYAKKLQEWGKPVEVAEFEGQQHGFFTINPWSQPANQLMLLIKKFIQENSGGGGGSS